MFREDLAGEILPQSPRLPSCRLWPVVMFESSTTRQIRVQSSALSNAEKHLLQHLGRVPDHVQIER